MTAGQASLFGHESTSIDSSFAAIERIPLANDAWLDLARGWVKGSEPLFSRLEAETSWRAESRTMYERTIAVPRLIASEKDAPALPIFTDMRAALAERYGTRFERLGFALYRSGEDSVAWHGDHVARHMREALVATVSVGAPRKFMLRPHGGGASISFSLGWGDLLVMGGTCQRTWQHAIPKAAHADPRMAIMFRPVWDAGRKTHPE